MPSFAFTFRFAPLAAAMALVLISPDAAAASKREQAVAALNSRMTTAEKRYRDALVKIGNNDPAGLSESNAALEDMEDVVDACGKQKGCEVTNLITVYKRLLKLNADAQGQIPEE